MERQIDFWRERQMLCGICDRQWSVGLPWIDRWNQGKETCLGCGTTCEHERSPRVTVDPWDPALDDDQVARFPWYHTSTQSDWPTKDFDPAADFTPEGRLMRGSDEEVAGWAARQRAKALHVGTYEAAVHNMLRRIHDQGDRSRQFYLYRVHLKASVVVWKDWLIEPGNLVGDVWLSEVVPPGIDVARYLNHLEDPGGLSLALGRDAIAGVQQVAVPLLDAWYESWVRDAVVALEDTSETVVPPTDSLSSFMPQSSPRAALGCDLAKALADRLPVNLQDQFASAAAFAEGMDPVRWARRTSGLVDLIENPGRVLAKVDGSGHRRV